MNTGILDVALKIAEEQDALLGQLRSALQSGDDVQALTLAKQLCGLNREEKRNRANPRIN